MNEDYVVRVFSVVIPAMKNDDRSGKNMMSYCDEICPFDYAMNYDMKDGLPTYVGAMN